jgi:YVTN family beta-propeller protein
VTAPAPHADHESNLISIIDTATDTVIGQVPVQTSPHSVAVNPARPLANVNYDANSVTMIDPATTKVIATIPVGRTRKTSSGLRTVGSAHVANSRTTPSR